MSCPLQPPLHTEHHGEDERASPREDLDPISGPVTRSKAHQAEGSKQDALAGREEEVE